MRNRLLELRQAKGLTQSELGEDLNVSRQTIAAIEKGRYQPSLRLAFKIARYFGHTIEEIFHEDHQ
ncbi:helix-turn-helix transcriptional regulator [Sphaerisporangium corydalis]|uniref:Helix-turn-helix transcriptional regulator n=1 Tax=Sphaerisporangium corydalis TaxID=1441875 RepID=A0ABV9EPJ4_9ACTN|nr:helix-turn-helix transcriptional regulator [Sphaerisporangium corydalis]